MSRFADRTHAGRALAERLVEYARRDDVTILGLARGGVPVAAEAAKVLHLPFDVFLVRKLGVPGHAELAMGAIASGGVRVMNEDVVRELGLAPDAVESVTAEERAELERRERAYRGDRPPAPIAGRTVLVVDDGLATGASMRAAIRALVDRGAHAIVVAAPVAPAETCAELEAEADDVVCAYTPDPFRAVGLWYDDFGQVSDDEVRELLAAAP